LSPAFPWRPSPLSSTGFSCMYLRHVARRILQCSPTSWNPIPFGPRLGSDSALKDQVKSLARCTIIYCAPGHRCQEFVSDACANCQVLRHFSEHDKSLLEYDNYDRSCHGRFTGTMVCQQAPIMLFSVRLRISHGQVLCIMKVWTKVSQCSCEMSAHVVKAEWLYIIFWS
jgi:hypothetical protein